MLSHRFASWICRLFHQPAAGRAELKLERLEDRLTPSAANNVFVSSLYQGLLGRNADQAGLTYWAGQINAGVSRTQVATTIAGSNEALGRDVQRLYDVLLDRPADANGLDYWTNQLATGATLNQAQAGILGSHEFYTKAGGTDAGFLNALYSDELGRSVDEAGLNYWENQLNLGVSRTTVAGEVLATPETNNAKVTSFFNDVLGRAPDADGLNYWSGQLQAGVPEAQVLGGILGSNEYFAQVQNSAGAPTYTAPNQTAADTAGALDPATQPLPDAEYLAPGFVNVPVVIAPAVAPSSAVSVTGVVNSAPPNVSAPVPPGATQQGGAAAQLAALQQQAAQAAQQAALQFQAAQAAQQAFWPQQQNEAAQQAAQVTASQQQQAAATAQPAASPQQGGAAAQLAALQQQAAQAAQQAALQFQAAQAAQQANETQQQDDANQQDDGQQQQDVADQMGASEPAWQQTQDHLADIQQQEADEAAWQAAVQQQDDYDMSVLQNAQDQLQAEFAAQQQ